MDSIVYCTKDGYTDCCYMEAYPHAEYGPYYMCNLIDIAGSDGASVNIAESGIIEEDQ
jgi:hypothetical protein